MRKPDLLLLLFVVVTAGAIYTTTSEPEMRTPTSLASEHSIR